MLGALPASAQEDNGGAVSGGGEAGIELGPEYEQYRRTRGQKTPHTKTSSAGRTVLLYLPNRILDFIDIFRVDAGVGPATGGVIRVTKWGQAGMRYFSPASLRVGLRGREMPVFLERSSEFGIGPAFVESKERKTTPVEVGLGIDLFLVGAYAGLSLDSAVDFILGFFGVDISDDDL
jgi:hypothetical protein